MAVVNVKACRMCPFAFWAPARAWAACSHPHLPRALEEREALRVDDDADEGFGKDNQHWNDPPPSWCPLRRESLTIGLTSSALKSKGHNERD